MEPNSDTLPREPATSSTRPKRRVPRDWTRFDVLFGIVLPLVCLVLDPGIVRGRGMFRVGPEILTSNAISVYGLVVPAIFILGFWLGWKRGAIYVAGPLFVGAAVALAIGTVLLPLSIPAAVIVIGLLGLVPFGTAATCWRNGLGAFRHARTAHSAARAAGVAILLGAVTLALPLGLQVVAHRRTSEAVAAALSGDPEREVNAIARLRPFGRWIGEERFRAALFATRDPSVDERLRRVWLAATGDHLTESD